MYKFTQPQFRHQRIPYGKIQKCPMLYLYLQFDLYEQRPPDKYVIKNGAQQTYRLNKNEIFELVLVQIKNTLYIN